MAYSSNDFLSWDDDIDLDTLLGDYTADESDQQISSMKQDIMYICPDCKKEYKSISGFRGHVLKKHDKTLKASDHRKDQPAVSTSLPTCTNEESCKLQDVFPKAYKQSLQNVQHGPLYNIFDNSEATIAAACTTNVETEQYFNDFMTECFMNNNVSSQAGREIFFKKVHQKRTDKTLLQRGMTLLKSITKDCEPSDLLNFIQVIVLDLIGEIIKEMKIMETKESQKKQSNITDADNSILYYISGFIIKALEKKYSKLKNNMDKQKHLKDIDTLKNHSSEKTFTQKFSVWYEKKNRGGLKKPTDNFFFLIREFERLSRENQNLEKIACKELILDSFMVHHYCEKLFDTQTCSYVEDALGIFTTVRGYAYARAEQRKYKKEAASELKGKSSASLRGVLKNVSNSVHK